MRYLILLPLIFFCCTSSNQDDKSIHDNTNIFSKIKTNDQNDVEKNEDHRILVICFIGENIYFNNTLIERNELKNELSSFIEDRLSKEINIMSIKIFYEYIEYSDYEPLYYQIKSVYKKHLDKISNSIYNKDFDNLSSSEKSGMPFKVFISDSEKNLIENYKIPNHLKCN